MNSTNSELKVRQQVREELARDIEEFLSNGGKIDVLPGYERSDYNFGVDFSVNIKKRQERCDEIAKKKQSRDGSGQS